MSIAPIVQTVTVAVPPDRAFALFNGSMGRWWKRGMTIGAKPHVEIIVEPRSGGRWFERDEDGAEADWGKVLAWEPPGRVLLGWQLDASFKRDPDLITEVEVTFVPEGTGTRVTLTHRNLERFGDSADRVASQLSGGWPTLMQLYADITKGKWSMTEFVVHGVPGSPYVQTVLMTLEEKGLPWRLQSLNLGGNRTPGYRAIHPFQKIPTIDHGDFRLYETSAILNYIDRLEPTPPLRPNDIRRAARMDQVISIVNAYLAPRVSGAVTFPLLVAPKLGISLDTDPARAAVPQAREVIDELALLLADQEYMAGPSISLADLMLASHLSFLPDFAEGEAMLGDHANMRAWIARMTSRSSFRATEWEVLLERFPMPVPA